VFDDQPLLKFAAGLWQQEFTLITFVL